MLGPLLWNIMYDGVLRLQLPHGVRIVGFADDIAVVSVGKHIHHVESITDDAIAQVRAWLDAAGLELAGHKTEAVLIRSRKKIEYMSIKVGEHIIKSTNSIKYLGVMIDNRLSFKEHVSYAGAKAAGIQSSLARMLPNIGGPKPARRRLLSTVVNSVILYASPVWADALMIKTTKRKLTSIYRLSALRTISGFCTISDEAACVIAGMVPIDILVDEMRRVYDRTHETPANRRVIAKEEREASIATWQVRWNNSTKGRWTYQLIPNVATWIRRSHGEVNYYVTQFLTGHGCFRKYLHRFGHDSSPTCPNCGEVEEDVNHVMFYCPRFRVVRSGIPVVENVMEFMLHSDDNWNTIGSFTSNVLEDLRRIERRRGEETESI